MNPLEPTTFAPIGVLKTCFTEKFGVPRQSGLVKHAWGTLKLRQDPFLRTAVRELEGFSHLWLIFIFHQPNAKSWKPSIRPPRLGGAKKVGVLASRSPHRPNPIGLSVVKLEGVYLDRPGGIEIEISGVDCLDGTPVLDIKPYLPYCDSIPDANAGWASEPIARRGVTFSPESLAWMKLHVTQKYPHFVDLVREILELDPRPAFQQPRFAPPNRSTEGTQHGFRLFEFDVHWEIREQQFYVYEVVYL